MGIRKRKALSEGEKKKKYKNVQFKKWARQIL